MSTQTVERTSTVETEAAALHRLAAQAREKGVRIVQNLVTNAHFATSASRPGTLHKVTLYSCDCEGFLRHGRCMHLAAVLAMYHSLPRVEPEPTPDEGAGVVPAALAEDEVAAEHAFLRLVMDVCDDDDAWYFLRTSPLGACAPAGMAAVAFVGEEVRHAA